MLRCSFRQIVLDRSVKFNTLIETVTLCGGKILLFWFCEGSACVSGKTKCAKCAAGKFNFFVRWGVLIFSWVGLCVANLVYGLCRNTAKLSAEFGRPKSLVKMSKVDCFVVSFMIVVSSFRLAYNGLQLQEVGDFGDENCLPAINLIRTQSFI
jgi:hypothetical protein